MGAARLAREEWLQGLLALIDAMPAAARRPAARILRDAASRAVRRHGDHPLVAPVHVLATYAAGGGAQAIGALHRHVGSVGERPAATLARLALAFDEPLLAERLASRAGGSRPALWARVELAMGLYRQALQTADAGLAAGGPSASLWSVRARAAGELALLDPAWRPVVRGGRLTERQRGRVVHLLTNSLPQRQAGYTLRAQAVADCQRAAGLEPVMVTRAGFPGTEATGRASDVDVIDGIPYHRIAPMLAPGLPVDRVAAETAAGLAMLVHRFRPALLQPTSNYVNAQVALGVGEALGVPVVYEVRGFLEATWLSRIGEVGRSADRYAAAREAETACMRRAAAVVTLSETMRDDILGRGGIHRDRVVVVPNAVNLEAFRPGPRDTNLAASLGIEPSETVIGYVSSFSSYEGIGYLVEAVAKIRARGCSARLLLVGDGEDTPNLRAIAARTGLDRGRGVIFTGRVPFADVQRYYRTIDIFVVPRTADLVAQLVTPLKPYEAMAMAKAMVVSRVGALTEIVADGETGRTFRAEDAGDLADVLEELVGDLGQRARLGEAARAWVAANRTWDLNGRRYRELYARLGVA